MKHMARNPLRALTMGIVALAVGVATLVPVPTSAQHADQEVVLKVSGMTCGGCAIAVKMAAKKIDGVSQADVSLKAQTATVTYDPSRTTPDKIAQGITEKTGFVTELARDRESDQ